LPAQVVEGKPGFVLSPYANPPKEVRIAARKWKHGGVADCPLTARPLRLPDELPPLPKRPVTSALVGLAAVALLVAVSLIAWAPWKEKAGGESIGGEPSTGTSPAIPNSQVGNDPKPAIAAVEPKEPPPPPLSPWPDLVVFAKGVEPPSASVEAILVLASGETSTVPLTPEKGAVRWTIDLTEALHHEDAFELASLSLAFSAEGFQNSTLPVPKQEKGWEEGTFASPNLLSLERLTAKVSVAGELDHPCYGSVRFRMVEAPGELRPDPDPIEFKFDDPKLKNLALNTGVYRVSLVGRPGLEHSKGPVEVAERILHEKLPIDGTSPAKVEVPKWPLPRSAVGVERTTLVLENTALFGRPRDENLGYSPGKPAPFDVDRGIILDLGQNRLEGLVFGENIVLFDAAPFDTLGAHLAYNLIESLNSQFGTKRKTDGLKDFSTILPYLDAFSASTPTRDGNQISYTHKDAWNFRVSRLTALSGLARRTETNSLQKLNAVFTAETYATTAYKEKLKHSDRGNSGDDYLPLCQAIWLKSLLPAATATPEYQSLTREQIDFLSAYRREDERTIGLPNHRRAPAPAHQVCRCVPCFRVSS
jgi:hypothetical protein